MDLNNINDSKDSSICTGNASDSNLRVFFRPKND